MAKNKPQQMPVLVRFLKGESLSGTPPLAKNKPQQMPERRYFRTGIRGFDALFKNGIPLGNAVLVEGSPGSGKTIFCLHVALNACEQGYKVLFMSFEEPEKNLIRHMTGMKRDPEKFIKDGRLMLRRFNALDIARSVEALLSEAKKELLIEVQPVLIPKDFEPDIVLIDSLTSISSAFSGESYRFRIYMEQFFRYLETHNITSFLVRESPIPLHTGTSVVDTSDAVSFLSDGIIVLYNSFSPSGFRTRAVEVLKMRGEQIERKIVEMEIGVDSELTVYPNRGIPKDCKLT